MASSRAIEQTITFTINNSHNDAAEREAKDPNHIHSSSIICTNLPNEIEVSMNAPISNENAGTVGMLTGCFAASADVEPLKKKLFETVAEQLSAYLQKCFLNKQTTAQLGLLNDIQSIAKIGAWEFHYHAKGVFWSDEIYRIYGVSKNQSLTPNEAMSFYAPQSQEKIKRAFHDLTTNLEAYDLELAFTDASGNAKWVRTTGNSEVDQQGKVVRVYGTFEDVTEARLISTRLKEHTETLENILNNLNDAVITINSEGQIRQCNEVAVRLFGYDKSEPIGANVAMLMPQPYAMKHDSYMQHYKATGEAKIIGVGRQLPARRKNGDVFQMELSLTESVEKGEKQYIGLVRDISDRQYNQLRSIQANYLRRETLVDANDAICNAIARLPIFKHYQIQENLLHASADGQKFESRLETFKTRYASKYFGTNKGVSAVTLVANHAAINAKMIGANEHESHFIYDLLFSNTSDIKPDVLSTDTHGANHMNFALLDLSGYAFAPRYANVGSVIDDQFSIHNEQLVMKTPIDIATVESQWDVAQRIMISLQRKTTTQAVLVRKLSGYPKDHPLLKAITEYNRLVKALYILNYMGDEKLRKHVQRALNRGEAYHQLRRAIASVNGNRFRGSTDYEIELWNDCARLLTNAIIYFNSLVLSKLLVHFEHTGQIDMLTLTQQVSPVAWTNINLNGTYSFNFGQDILDMDELIRPITEEEVLIEN
ncbi:hypothetical protein CW735_09300 [Alteromonas sp. MB-3u-76]|nr:hypothetical protein BM528_05290 [Alteromonas sp. RW2A1]AUC88360.1 hypothetical protein CW735_09300 [Alteromonas sp. MB-3u-76]